MKCLITLFLFVSLNAFAEKEAVYGDDNRLDVYLVQNPLYVGLSTSTAAMIEKTKIKANGKVSLITSKSLGEMFKLCPEERFRNQPTAATCSGTLVAPDLILTAGHCYDFAKKNCKDFVWVFDYKVSKDTQSSVTVNNTNIYECAKVVHKEINEKTGTDHALIKLSRPVSDRAYAKLRSIGKIAINDSLVLIGHPNGLPTKIAADAFVLKILKHTFISNVDAFSVNSGSGVFNSKTGEVEGILVSGQADYNGKGNCSTIKRYEMKEGNETISNVDSIKTILNQL